LDEEIPWCRQNGADWGINYEQHDVVVEAMKITNDKGVEVVLDTVDVEAFTTSINGAEIMEKLCFMPQNSLTRKVAYENRNARRTRRPSY